MDLDGCRRCVYVQVYDDGMSSSVPTPISHNTSIAYKTYPKSRPFNPISYPPNQPKTPYTMHSSILFSLLLSLSTTLTLAQDQAISDAETTASGNTLNTSTQAPAEATSAAQSVASSIASEAFSSALSSAASSISERVAESPSATPTEGAAAPTKGMFLLAEKIDGRGIYANLPE